MEYSTTVELNGQVYTFRGRIKTRNTGNTFQCPNCGSLLPLDTVNRADYFIFSRKRQRSQNSSLSSDEIEAVIEKVNELLLQETLKKIEETGACDICHR